MGFYFENRSKAYNGANTDDFPTIDNNKHLRNNSDINMGCIEDNTNSYDFDIPEMAENVNTNDINSSDATISWEDGYDSTGIYLTHIIIDDEHYKLKGNSLNITGLYPSYTYDYKIYEEDFGNNISESASNSFKTTSVESNDEILTCRSSTYDFELTSDNKKNWMFERSFNVNYNQNAILFFEIPAIPSNRKIVNASLSLNLLDKNINNSNVDIYALDYERDHDIYSEYFWNGPFGDENSIGTKIQDDFITKDSPSGNISSNFAGSKAIVDYIDAQITNGAHANNYLIFKLNIDNEDIPEDEYFKIASSDNFYSNKWPKLKLYLEDVTSNSELITEEFIPSLYPNPSNDLIFINKNGCDYSYIMIMDYTGRMVKKLDKKSAEGGINISELQQGLYFIKFIGKENYSIKFTKI
ncbi:MAG: T9SS type A sorting domain-containing protein [Saprospiraceae bacterium]